MGHPRGWFLASALISERFRRSTDWAGRPPLESLPALYERSDHGSSGPYLAADLWASGFRLAVPQVSLAYAVKLGGCDRVYQPSAANKLREAAMVCSGSTLQTASQRHGLLP
jgi:hypothetical protein